VRGEGLGFHTARCTATKCSHRKPRRQMLYAMAKITHRLDLVHWDGRLRQRVFTAERALRGVRAAVRRGWRVGPYWLTVACCRLNCYGERASSALDRRGAVQGATTLKVIPTCWAASRGTLCVSLCALLAACYSPDQPKLDKEVRALVHPGMTMAEARDRLSFHGFSCASFQGTPQVGDQLAVGCARYRGLGCMEPVDLEPENWRPLVTAVDVRRIVCTWF
jgi:hypothetical protein